MKYSLVLIAFMGCSLDDYTPQEREAKSAFETWRAAMLNGDFETAYSLMSRTYQSYWIYRIFLIEDSAKLESWRDRLPRQAREDFAVWFEFHARRQSQRPEIPLVESVTETGWVWNVLEEDYRKKKDAIRVQFEKYQVSGVAVLGSEATVTVRNLEGTTELFVMISEMGRWKIDGHVPPQQVIPR